MPPIGARAISHRRNLVLLRDSSTLFCWQASVVDERTLLSERCGSHGVAWPRGDGMTKTTWVAVLGPRRSRVYQLSAGVLSEVVDVERAAGPLGLDGCNCASRDTSTETGAHTCGDTLSEHFAQLLEAQHRRGAFDRLILMGGEDPLARLKDHFHDSLVECVAREVHYDDGAELPAERVRGLLEHDVEAQ